MGTARRLYLYTISWVSLLALTGGLGSILQLLLQRVQDDLAGVSALEGGATSAQAAMSIAMIAVGAPVWGLHWSLVRRGMRRAAPEGHNERTSAARAWYLALVMGVSLAAAVAALVALVSAGARAFAGVAEDEAWALPLAVALVAVPTWAAHARMRWQDIRATRMSGAAAWVTRLYRYLASYALLVMLLTGAAGLIETLLSVLIGRPDFDPRGTGWRYIAAGQAASIAVGWAAWLLHWGEAGATVRAAAQIGEDDRVSRLRTVFFGGSLLTVVTWVALGVASAIASAGRLLTGMSQASPTAWLEDVVGPPVALLPLALAAWWLTVSVRREAAGTGRLEALAAARLTTLLTSLAGIAFLAAGVVQLLETGLYRLGAGEPDPVIYGQSDNAQLPWYVAQVLVGLVLWLPTWRLALEARRREPELERTAGGSRGYLFLVVGTALVTAIPAAIAILYRLLEPVLGGTSSTPVLADLAFPIAVLLVATAAGAYHARILSGDLAVRVAAVPANAMVEAPLGQAPEAYESPVAPSVGAGRTPDVERVATIELVLEVPEGEDAPAVVAGLASHLPPGARLHLRPVG